jgi:hypothetical protein
VPGGGFSAQARFAAFHASRTAAWRSGFGFGSTTPAFYHEHTSVIGIVRIDIDDNPGYSNGPDGGTLYTRTNVTSMGGIAAVIHDSRTMFLVGVFLDEPSPGSQPALVGFQSHRSGRHLQLPLTPVVTGVLYR